MQSLNKTESRFTTPLNQRMARRVGQILGAFIVQTLARGQAF
jgi:hypothetical protein